MINEEVSDKTLNLEIKAAKITAKLIIQQIKKLLKEAKEIKEMFSENGINVISTGGCDNLKYWVTKKLVQQFNLPWAIFLDSDKKNKNDISKNTKFVDKISSEGILAFCTRKREIENYLHSELLKNEFKKQYGINFSADCGG